MPHQCLFAKGSAGVASEVNLEESVTHMPLPSTNKTAHSGFETVRRHPKQGSVTPQIESMSSKFILKKFKKYPAKKIM